MEDAVEQGGPRAKLGQPAQEKDQSARAFGDQDQAKHPAHDQQNIVRRIEIESFLKREFFRDKELLAEDQHDKGGQGHVTEAAKLDHDQYNDQAGQRKMCAGIERYQPGDAGGGTGREAGVEPIGRRAARRRNRQGKQDGSRQDKDQKAEDNNQARTQAHGCYLITISA